MLLKFTAPPFNILIKSSPKSPSSSFLYLKRCICLHFLHCFRKLKFQFFIWAHTPN